MSGEGRQKRGSIDAASADLLRQAGVMLGRPAAEDAAARVARERARASAPRDRSALGTGLLAAVAAVLAFLMLWAASGTCSRIAHAQGAEALRASILSAADQCYAVEGAYPATLRYLEERYALAVNHEGYDVLYDAFASNIAPTVVVRPL